MWIWVRLLWSRLRAWWAPVPVVTAEIVADAVVEVAYISPTRAMHEITRCDICVREVR